MSGGKNSIMLFGVQLTEGTNNTNNSQYQQPLHQVADATSVADNVIDHASAGTSGTKRPLHQVADATSVADNVIDHASAGTSGTKRPLHQVADATSVADNVIDHASAGTSGTKRPLHQVADATSVADNVIDHASAGTSGTKRGNWTEEEHRGFLEALKQDCKGKWKTISTDFVKTRTPTQVASHAQKHYLPRPNRRGKHSVFDLTIDTDNTNMQHNQLGEMNRQGSLTSSGDLSKKTVDNDMDSEAFDRQQTLGEMTSEDSGQQTLGEMTSEDSGQQTLASGIVVEKTMERRNKNRESAARSRARKQAYIQELERKVSYLEEENERLRKHNEVKSSTIMRDEQIRQETVVPLPPTTPTAYPSTHNGGILNNPLPMGLGTVVLPVLSSWVDLNDNGSSSSLRLFHYHRS